MPLVIDASVAVKWLTPENLTDKARALLSVPEPLIAPDWILIEAASALWRKVKRSELLIVHAEQHVEDLPRFFERLMPAADLVNDAVTLSFRLRHPVYDCLYLVLAQREDTHVVTADEPLAVAATRAGLGRHVELLA